MNGICRQCPVENSREAIKKGKMGSHFFFLSDEARAVKEVVYKKRDTQEAFTQFVLRQNQITDERIEDQAKADMIYVTNYRVTSS